jgi:DNA-binding MarR family transcriptional regulator
MKRPLTASLPSLLERGSDLAFREMVADLFASVAGMQALRRALAARVGLSAGAFSVLLATRHLQARGAVAIRTVAQHLHAAPANITADVNALVSARLVRKRDHPEDSRAVDIALTAKGERLLDDLAPLLRRVNDALFAGNNRAEIAAVAKFLKHLAGESKHAERLVRTAI